MERSRTSDEVMEKRLDKYLRVVKFDLKDTTNKNHKFRSKHDLKRLLSFLREAAIIEYRSVEAENRHSDEESLPLHDSERLSSHLGDVLFSEGWRGGTQIDAFDQIVQLAQGSSEKISDYGLKLYGIGSFLEEKFSPILMAAWIAGLSDHRIPATMETFSYLEEFSFSEIIECAKFLKKVFKLQAHITTAAQALESVRSLKKFRGIGYSNPVEDLLKQLDKDLAKCITRFKVFEDKITIVGGSANTSGPVTSPQ